MNEIIPFAEMDKMANAITKSGLFGIKDANQAVALMLVAQAEGRHPASVARDYNIISGRPALKADSMLARFQEAGGKVQWHVVSNDKAEATFSHPSGGEVRMSWTIEDAKKAGLAGKSGPWQQFPRAMLRSRLISEGIRTVFPGVICGVYTPEEVQDFAPEKPIEKPVVVLATAEELDLARGALKAAGIKLSDDLVAEIRGGVTKGRLDEIVRVAIQGQQGTATLKEKMAKAIDVVPAVETTDFPGVASGS